MLAISFHLLHLTRKPNLVRHCGLPVLSWDRRVTIVLPTLDNHVIDFLPAAHLNACSEAWVTIPRPSQGLIWKSEWPPGVTCKRSNRSLSPGPAVSPQVLGTPRRLLHVVVWILRINDLLSCRIKKEIEISSPVNSVLPCECTLLDEVVMVGGATVDARAPAGAEGMMRGCIVLGVRASYEAEDQG